MIKILLFLLTLFSFNTAVAQQNKKQFIKIVRAPSFGLPIDCTIGQDCWIMNYVDLGPDDGKKTDHACLERTYDAHKGTDFAISDGVAMTNGVNVLAAMDGTVKRVRDGETDRWPTKEDLKTVQEQRKECGNAIMIDHGDGWQSLYCHLKNGSVKVKPDQKIKKGDVIAQVGLSGFTQFPHVHFGILKDGKIIDPFTGTTNTEQCGKKGNALWDKDLALEYQPLIIQAAGFTDIIPVFSEIEKSGKTASTLDLGTDIMAFWVTILGARKGDEIAMEVKDPNGKTFTKREIVQEKNRARQFYYTGRKLENIDLIEGGYTGSVKVIRKDTDGKSREWNKAQAILVTP